VRGVKQAGSVTFFGYLSNNNTSSAMVTFIASLDIGYNGENAIPIAPTSGVTLAQHAVAGFIIDDTMSAVFPDLGNESYISDIDLYYTANPGMRLRGGRTFTNGVDHGLGVTP